MDEPQEHPPESSETHNPLPDVVHSQQIPVAGIAVAVETEVVERYSNRISTDETPSQNAVETSVTESISEHVPFQVHYSTESDQPATHSQSEKQDVDQEKVPKHLNIPQTLSLSEHDNPSTNDPGRHMSWPADSPADANLISEESPVNLALSSDLSKDGQSKLAVEIPRNSNSSSPEPSLTLKEDSEKGDGSEYADSLNDEATNVSNSIYIGTDSVGSGQSNVDKSQKSSTSEEMIKLDIRGQGVPKFSLPTAKIIFGPPPEGSNILDPTEQLPAFHKLLSPFLVGAGESIQVEDIFDFDSNMKDVNYEADDRDPSLFQSKEATPDQTNDYPYQVVELEETFPDTKEPSPESDTSLLSDQEQDVLLEEVTVDYETKQRENDASIPTQPKSLAPDDVSFTTTTTDYKTVCEEFQAKLVHLEEALTRRDDLIEELTISLQRSVHERDDLQNENVHFSREVQNLQHLVAEHSNSEHNTVMGQLSDFMQYEKLLKDGSKKLFSDKSCSSSNSEKDNDREEITVNYSRSDLKSDGSVNEFQTGFENKLMTVIDKFDEYIEENLRNKLRESIIQVLCDEIGKMRLESDTEIKELESQMLQDKQSYNKELTRLGELIASVKAGNADIDALREEMGNIHEKEMENLRTYFEKKCSDMERSYSEEVWRGRCASPTGSQSSDTDACGDCPRRRARSADLPSLTIEPSQLEQALKQANKKLEETKAEHMNYVTQLQANHRDAVNALEEQINQLKAHIQTAENTEGNMSVSLYQQDIDLELEKSVAFEARLEEVRQEVVHELQDQIKVLLSDPDAEVTSWPLELVALRDKIQGDARALHDKELSSLRDELCGETDKWKQRRNSSFDQNRQLEEVTKERDGLRRVAGVLQRCVSQLVAYCACAEDELNRTVLARLLATIDTTSNLEIENQDSRPSTPNLSLDLNTSAVSRSSKHVHFAPDLQSILAELDEDGLVGFLQEQRDVSADIKKELEHSLRRLRHEAHELLDLSLKLSTKTPEANMLEAPAVKITELVDKMDAKHCENCQIHKKTMEETMSECIQRESLLRADLDAAMIRIDTFMTERRDSDLIAEGYGTVPPLLRPLSLPSPVAVRRPDSGAMSLDGCASPRAHMARMAHDLDLVVRERDDLQQQLEAANRQLRSTRQFVEEQAAERESERDEFARRLADLREENQRLATRLQTNARILSEVEQLESQTREMTQIITELESRKLSADEQIKTSEEKVSLLRDIIANLETQLEQKNTNEVEILQQLEVMRNTIDERDGKMRIVLGELRSLKSERADNSEVLCVKCGLEEDRYNELQDKLKEQCQQLEELVHHRTRRLEKVHEVCSAPCSEPSEDVSKRDQRNAHMELSSGSPSPRIQPMAELVGVWECLQSLTRAEDAAIKRLADVEMQRNQLKDIAQEVRAERDVLQTRMSEQALRISSLSARLQQQRNDAEALAHCAHSQLSVQLHDALAEVQRLGEELESKDKQLVRVRQNLEEREKLSDKHQSLYGNSCNPKDKVIILERELSSAQNRIAQLEAEVRSMESDNIALKEALNKNQRALADREEQLQDILALKLDEDNNKDDRSDIIDANKTSARTLSDIVSISEFDEQDLQMRRAELKNNNLNLTGAPFDTNKVVDVTNTPDVQRHNMSSLNIDFGDHFDAINSPRADSLPAHLTSTQNKDIFKEFKRNNNETTVFGTAEKSNEVQKIPDNCSLYPNRDVSDTKNVSVEPKKIDFSLEASDNKTEEHFSLKDLGITLDLKQENFPDILTQLKAEIRKSRNEINQYKSELKNAEEQLCEFPALKEEVEELKELLENTMATMNNDKKFYEDQLKNFSLNKNMLEQRLTELTQEVNDKSKDLHLLKEEVMRRENMVLELAKEKRNLTNKLTELDVKIDELQSRNNLLEKYESESHHLRDKLPELKKLEQLLSEKNHQIDSLNQHLDRLDDLQRRLNDKTYELNALKEEHEQKSSELFRLQDLIESLTQNVSQLNEQNKSLSETNKELKLKLSKAEKELENASIKLQSSESEIERVNQLNNELSSKIDELKQLTERLKDKETEIEILNEDTNAFHEEIATLKEQLQMVSRSPSPRRKEEKPTRRAVCDSKQLARIRKQVSLLQHELDFNKKELNDKVFELSKAKLDVTELRNNLGQATKVAIDKENVCKELVQANEDLKKDLDKAMQEKQRMAEQLEMVVARIREEGNIDELKAKLREKTDRCQDLESEMQDMKELVERLRELQPINPEDQRALVVSGTRSPTAELERALRDQLNYSHTLDEDIMEQILSASSDERDDIPRLALNSSSKSSSIHSSTSERLHRMKADNDKLVMQVTSLEARLRDKDALITELNRIRDKLEQECQSMTQKYECERDAAGRLQLLLDTQKQTSQSLQNQDTNMITILKKRLEAAMQSELELQQKEQQSRHRVAQLERQLLNGDDASKGQLQHELENVERLRGEISLLKSRLDVERSRYSDLQALFDHSKLQFQRDIDLKNDACQSLMNELVELKRQKKDVSAELVRAKELSRAQAAAIAQLENKMAASPKPLRHALTEIETHKTELSRELATLKRCISTTLETSPDVHTLRADRQRLQARVEELERAGGVSSHDREQAIRYLQGRNLRLESCRKALVWQKRYLQRVLAGYEKMETRLKLTHPAPEPVKPLRRFKCVAVAVLAFLRMGFLVRRRHHVRSISTNCLLKPRDPALNTTTHLSVSTSPPTRDRPRTDSLARRVLNPDLRLHLPASPAEGEYSLPRSPFANSPRDHPFVLSTPRGEVAAAYLSKLELVSRCLSQAMDASRDTP